MTKDEFLKEVRIELDTIRERATKEEKDRLDFSKFAYYSATNCIYGQMTGSCNSERAKELYPKKYSEIRFYGGDEYKDISHLKGNNYTDLEQYLYLVADKDIRKYSRNTEKHKELIDYIKGNINEIQL